VSNESADILRMLNANAKALGSVYSDSDRLIDLYVYVNIDMKVGVCC